MFGKCNRKIEAEITQEHVRVYCSHIDKEVKLGGKATIKVAQKKLCYKCDEAKDLVQK